jgi:hypothetical protein
MNRAVEIAMTGTTDKMICEAIPLNFMFFTAFAFQLTDRLSAPWTRRFMNAERGTSTDHRSRLRR